MARERCPAFLIEDFEAAAREVESAVERLYRANWSTQQSLADGHSGSEDARSRAERQPEWQHAQRAMMAQLKARVALEEAGLSLPDEALRKVERAQRDFAAFAAALESGDA